MTAPKAAATSPDPITSTIGPTFGLAVVELDVVAVLAVNPPCEFEVVFVENVDGVVGFGVVIVSDPPVEGAVLKTAISVLVAAAEPVG
jgi:hypothetical protein